MAMRSIEQALTQHGMLLAAAPAPVGAYRAAVESGGLLYVSGQLPYRDGVLAYIGRLGENLAVADGYAAARLCALNLLSQLHSALQGRALARIVRIDGLVACTADFVEHAAVLNGASELLVTLLGDRAAHARSVAGCTSLPLGSAVEIAAVAEIASARRDRRAGLHA